MADWTASVTDWVPCELVIGLAAGTVAGAAAVVELVG
jgi:hypothetical protein